MLFTVNKTSSKPIQEDLRITVAGLKKEEITIQMAEDRESGNAASLIEIMVIQFLSCFNT